MLDTKAEGLAERGERIYRTKLKAILEPAHIGKYVVIEVESGDYFLGKTMSEAMVKAKKKYPDRLFHLMRVGYRAAVSFKHRFSL